MRTGLRRTAEVLEPHRHDSLAFGPVLAGIRVTRCGPGRPRTRLDRVLADKAYSSRRIRTSLRDKGIKATIPEPSAQMGLRSRRRHAMTFVGAIVTRAAAP